MYSKPPTQKVYKYITLLFFYLDDILTLVNFRGSKTLSLSFKTFLIIFPNENIELEPLKPSLLLVDYHGILSK